MSVPPFSPSGSIITAAGKLAGTSSSTALGEDFLALCSAFAYGTQKTVSPEVVAGVLSATAAQDFAAGGVLTILGLVDTSDITTVNPDFLPMLTAASLVGVCGEGAVSLPAFHAPTAAASDFLYLLTHGTGLVLLVVFTSLAGIGSAAGGYLVYARMMAKVSPLNPMRKPVMGNLRTFHTGNFNAEGVPLVGGGAAGAAGGGAGPSAAKVAPAPPSNPPRSLGPSNSAKIMRQTALQLEDVDADSSPLLSPGGPQMKVKSFGGGWN